MDDKTGSKTVLIVDDDYIVRMSLATLLEDYGWIVLSAQDGREGLALLEKNNPNRVIVDLNLPDLTGEEFLVQSYEIHRDAKYLLHTGDPDYRVPENLMEMGITQEQVLFKPLIDVQVLLDLL